MTTGDHCIIHCITELYSTRDTVQKLFYIRESPHFKGPLVMGICGHWDSRTGDNQIINLAIMKLSEILELPLYCNFCLITARGMKLCTRYLQYNWVRMMQIYSLWRSWIKWSSFTAVDKFSWGLIFLNYSWFAKMNPHENSSFFFLSFIIYFTLF